MPATIAYADLFRSATDRENLGYAGQSVEVTLDWARADVHRWNWRWLADHVLPGTAKQAYYEAEDIAQQAYDDVTEPAIEAYRQAEAIAHGRYWDARNRLPVTTEAEAEPAQAEYDATMAPLKRARDDAKAAAQLALDDARAIAFATAYLAA